MEKNEIIKKINNLANYKLIFSAHGLPEKNIKKGDPYQWQVEQSVKKIIENLNIENLDWILSYQSRVGPLKWIGPSTEDIIVENSKIAKFLKNKLFIKRIFSNSEILNATRTKYKKRYYSKRFAAKEAFSKALGTGITNGINFNEIIVMNEKSGKPFIKIIGTTKKIIKKKLNNKAKFFLSLSDEKNYAVAFVTISI